MPRNGSGQYNPLTNTWNPPVTGVLATGADFQAQLNDISAAITQSVSKDGQTPMTANLPMNNNSIVGLATGTNSSPSISPINDANTGLYFPAADTVGVAVGGVQALLIDSTGIEVPAGTVAAPSLTTTGDSNTGLYFPAADTIGVAVGGVQVAQISQSGFAVNGNNISAVNSLGFRNRIINGDMRIDQRNAGASVTPASNDYTVDRWQYNGTQASKVSVQQAVGTSIGYKNALKVTSASAYSVVAGDFFVLRHHVEGNNVADLQWGSGGAQAVTLSFWVNSSLTGTFGGSLVNSAQDRSYPFSYTINAANTWEQKTITVAGPTTGTWLTDNGRGLTVAFNLGSGSTYSGTSGAWANALYHAPTGATSVVGTSGATFYITGVQLEAGTVATPFERRDYGRELMMCQRYYCHSNGILSAPDVNTPGYFAAGIAVDIEDAALVSTTFPVLMRATPTLTLGRMYSFNNGLFKMITASIATAQSIGYLLHDSGNSGAGYVLGRTYKFSWTASAEL